MTNNFDIKKFFEQYEIEEKARLEENEEARRKCPVNCTYYDETGYFACTRCASV